LPAAPTCGSDGRMSTKSRQYLYGTQIQMSAEQAKIARKEADKLACVAWNHRMLGYKGPAQPSPTIGDAINAGFLYLEVRCLGCDTNQTIALRSFDAQRPRRCMNSNATCDAKTVRAREAIHTSEARLWR
jgi:hypothetical protein